MTITQTVEIPADRRLYLDMEIPHEITADKAFVTIQFPVPAEAQQEMPAEPRTAGKKIGMTRKELDEFLKNAHTPHSDALLGILSGAGDITLEQIREERLARKYPEYFK
ncbi:MAG: hypothetical protein FWH41_06305 [Treponema sp.]|nr:hypothetical protein [Treponema sp.]